MKTSTIWDKFKSLNKKWLRLGAVIFWIAVWQVAALCIGQEILLASPVSVLQRLWQLLPQPDFWAATAFSTLRILSGFLLACVIGSLLAALAARFILARELVSPLISVVKSVPVASFIIVALIWVSSKNLSVLISFLIVLPVIYANVLQGFSSMDKSLLEMAQVFHLPFWRRLRYIILPQVLPFFRSACAVSLGLCWKAGTAAEVIGLPQGSIGERLYEAKVYLETPDLFAWTLVIIGVSLLFEKVFLWGLHCFTQHMERG